MIEELRLRIEKECFENEFGIKLIKLSYQLITPCSNPVSNARRNAAMEIKGYVNVYIYSESGLAGY